MIEFLVNKEFSGFRLDKYLKEQNKDELYSRALIEKLILDKKVKVNSNFCTKKSFLVKENDTICVLYDTNHENQSKELTSYHLPLNIVYEDEYIAIIDKPAGLTVHPGAGNKENTLVNALLFHFGDNLSQVIQCPPLQGGGGGMLSIDKNSSEISRRDNLLIEDIDNFPLSITNYSFCSRPGIVHRLDKDTSGLIIITKDDVTHFKMSDLFMKREIEKTYLCICLGVPEPSTGTINKPITRHKTNRLKMTTVNADTDGFTQRWNGQVHSLRNKEAITHYKTLMDFEYFSLLEIKLETGRTHQIRVHLDSIHHPVIGDSVYNSMKRTLGSCPPNKQTSLKLFFNKNLQRQALHAWKIRFKHPILQKDIDIESELPNDLNKTIEFFKKMFVFYEY